MKKPVSLFMCLATVHQYNSVRHTTAQPVGYTEPYHRWLKADVSIFNDHARKSLSEYIGFTSLIPRKANDHAGKSLSVYIGFTSLIPTKAVM